ncbi:MAG: DUF4178 domain-containing protein [Pseudomonadota bacterium]
MITWLIIGLLVALITGAIARKRFANRQLAGPESLRALGQGQGRGQGNSDPSPLLLERTVLEARPNDIVQHDGRDMLVEGTITYEEDGRSFRAARLVDGSNEQWLIVGLDRGTRESGRLLRVASDLALAGYPPEQLVHGGVPFRLTRRGTATATLSGSIPGLSAAGTDSAISSVRCRYWDYDGAEGQSLFVEQWSDSYRAMVGRRISLDVLGFLPGS